MIYYCQISISNKWITVKEETESNAFAWLEEVERKLKMPTRVLKKFDF